MARRQMKCASLHKQKGVTTLLVALVILVTITFITLYTSRTVLMEQKITANEYRGRMAFEAAETGIEATLSAMSKGWLRTTDGTDSNDLPDLVAEDIVFDANSDGTALGNSNTFNYENGSRVRVTLSDSSTDDLMQTNVISTGESDDRSATRIIYQTIVTVPPIPNTPDSPLLTRGGVVIGGSATVTNPEGHSTIWSGGDVNLGANNSTATQIADPSDVNYPNCLGGSVQCGTVESSNREVVGVDVIEADSSLANLTDDEFFENFFGAEPEVYKDSRTSIVTTDLPAETGATSEIIWVEGDVDLSGTNTFGSMDEPVIVIVDGNFSGTGNNTFYGLLFVRGNISGTGSVDVVGSAIVNGIESSGGGSLDIVYNSKVLKTTFAQGRPAGGSGSWRDFNVEE